MCSNCYVKNKQQWKLSHYKVDIPFHNCNFDIFLPFSLISICECYAAKYYGVYLILHDLFNLANLQHMYQTEKI